MVLSKIDDAVWIGTSLELVHGIPNNEVYENSYLVHVSVCVLVCVTVMFKEALFGSQVSLRTPRGTLAPLSE